MSSDRKSAVPGRARPRRSPKILWREVDGCAVLFHEDSGRAFALNETATCVWKTCDGSRSMEDLSSLLAGPCEPDGEASRRAVERLVERLAEDGCVEMDSGNDLPQRTQRTQRKPGDGERRESKPSVDSVPSVAAVDCAAAPETWMAPSVEEIVFAACDCTGGGVGVIRNAQCVSLPHQQMSTI